MKNKAAILVFGMLACLFLLVVGSLWFKSVREKVNREYCLSCLHAIGSCVSLYSKDNNGTFPKNLQQLVDADKSLADAPFLLVCRGSGRLPGAVTNVVAWTDYAFIDWSDALGANAVPSDYPLAYDRHISNHNGHGVNVLTAGGCVRWDAQCNWLKKFANEHASVKLPMPE